MSLMDDIKALAGEIKAPFTGMGITQGASHQARVTIQYPEVHRPMPRRSRWRQRRPGSRQCAASS